MFVRVTADPATRPNTLGVLGMESNSNPIVNLSEFNYKKGTEIYGEKEPAEYVYQVKIGAVRSCNFIIHILAMLKHYNGSMDRMSVGVLHMQTV